MIIDYRKVQKFKGFDSKKEQRRYQELILLERAGEIKNLQRQKEIILQPSFKKDGKTYRAITYRADFYYEQNGRQVLEEVKGFETEVWKLKKKMVLFKTDFQLIITK